MDEVHCLVLEREESSHGWLLLMHRSSAEPSLFDSWFSSRVEAEKHARQNFGVASEDWREDGS